MPTAEGWAVTQCWSLLTPKLWDTSYSAGPGSDPTSRGTPLVISNILLIPLSLGTVPYKEVWVFLPADTDTNDADDGQMPALCHELPV